ncbi:MAG TPA: efflux RND transporter periplasmic adaptor subunit [Allocoleopsis sp.]
MDGVATPSQILSNFKSSFGLSLTEDDFHAFSIQISEFGLLEPIKQTVFANPSSSTYLEKSQGHFESPQVIEDSNQSEDIEPVVTAKNQSSKNKKGPIYLWCLPNPGSKFTLVASAIQSFGQFFKLLVWGLIPGLPIAFFTFFNNQPVFWRDIASSVEALPYLTVYIFNVTFVSLTAKFAQGVVCACYGGTVRKFGLVLAAGFFPRFYMDREGIWPLNTRQQLWTFATPLVSRLIYFVLGVFVWYWTRSTGTTLGTWALLLAHASFLDFLLDGCPLLPVDGYFWAVTYFRLPPTFMGRVYLVWQMVLSRRPLPPDLSLREKWGMLVYGPLAVVFWLSMVLLIAYSIATGLAENFPNIFGRATSAILIGAFAVAALRQPIAFFFKKKDKTTPSRRTSDLEDPLITKGSTTRKNKPNFWQKKEFRFLILLVLGLLLLFPYPYRPGGQIQLLPPTQQSIQAQVEGQIIKVMFNGGNGQWIKAGTPIAVMEAIDIENSVLTQQEQIKNQQAIVEKQQANLNKLLATPRKEDVEVARQQVEVAKQDVEVARQQVEVAKQDVEVAKKKLETAISRADFSTQEASRFEELYKGGVVSRQTFEDKQKQAETDRITVEENRQNVAAKQKEVGSSQNELLTKQQTVAQRQANLELVLSGPYPDDIQAARKELEAARAALQRQQQQLKYDREQLQRTQLLMPIDGYLVTAYLDQKVGSYLKKGSTFAIAEDDRRIQGELRVAEYDVGEFKLGASVEIKLWAYPNRPFIGKVVSIQPAASAENSSSFTIKAPTSNITDRFVRVIVDIPNADKILKSSMTGYAKISGSTQPAIVAFTRPIVRFIQIEIWSWLP